MISKQYHYDINTISQWYRTILLQYYNDIGTVSQRCYKNITTISLWYPHNITMISTQYHNGIISTNDCDACYNFNNTLLQLNQYDITISQLYFFKSRMISRRYNFIATISFEDLVVIHVKPLFDKWI